MGIYPRAQSGAAVDGARIFNAVVAYDCELKEIHNIVTRSPFACRKVLGRQSVITRR